MPKVQKPKIYEMEIIDEFNYPETKNHVLDYFSKYRLCNAKINNILNSYNCTLSNDNMGIFSSRISDPTSSKATKIIECKDYVEDMNKDFRKLRMRLTEEEKVIFNLSILSKHTDEELAEELSLDKTNIYQRKKSCFIKVAQYYNIEVFKED